jgi:hypothetical protein
MSVPIEGQGLPFQPDAGLGHLPGSLPTYTWVGLLVWLLVILGVVGFLVSLFRR